MDERATIAPFIGGSGELMLSEVVSLVANLVGLLIAYQGYINRDGRQVRVASLFILFFTIGLISESNLMRDDIRPQFLLILLIWISIELILERSLAAIGLIALGIFLPAIGQLGDHTTHIQFENMFGKPLSESVLAPWVDRFGALEEPFELAGWLLFAAAAAAALKTHILAEGRARFMALAVLAIAAIAIGNSFLHLRDDNEFESFRKLGFFCSVAGVASAGAAVLLQHGRRDMLARAYCLLFVVVAYWIAVYAPAVYRHEHSKTMSSWIWIFPVFAGYYTLVSCRRSYLRAASTRVHETP
ncbi:hypothetical protein [Salinisphaera sp.]|uniref:hypothetical protein n=1 Tax=Salinisphaera sp. TaxID=1914330 RepID=UPI000C4A28BA|nr:hypothetical protein [Salinisphaera sp.]MBS61974.1 hypothetical protein [Salinisphaera sp.]